MPEFSLPLPGPALTRASALAGVALLCVGGAWLVRSEPAGTGAPRLAAIRSAGNSAALRPVAQSLTSDEDLDRFHAPTSFGQAMGRDNGIILVSDWVESP